MTGPLERGFSIHQVLFYLAAHVDHICEGVGFESNHQQTHLLPNIVLENVNNLRIRFGNSKTAVELLDRKVEIIEGFVRSLMAVVKASRELRISFKTSEVLYHGIFQHQPGNIGVGFKEGPEPSFYGACDKMMKICSDIIPGSFIADSQSFQPEEEVVYRHIAVVELQSPFVVVRISVSKSRKSWS